MQQLVKLLEALLFAAGRPVSPAELASATSEPAEDVLAALEVLSSELSDRGITLVRTDSSFELATAPGLAPLVEKFLQAEHAAPLSKSALETLAIILGRQPVTRYEIEEVRGIASDQIIRNLLGRGLIEEAGHRHEAGRPMQYATTTTLLRHLGVTSVDELTEFKRAD